MKCRFRTGVRRSRVWIWTTSSPMSARTQRCSDNWKDVPQDIKDTFERLGIPQAERKSLAGVGAQYDSELVYHNVQDRGRGAGRGIHGYGERPEGRIRGHGPQIFYEAGHAAAIINSRHCTAQSGRAVRLCTCRRACRYRFRCSPISGLNAQGRGTV